MAFVKDEAFRQRALTENLWKLVWCIGAPLALFQGLNQAFKVLDTIMASYISSRSVSAVTYLNQITTVLSAVGAGLAAGGSLKISQAYGAGDYEMVQRRVSSLVVMAAALGAIVLAVAIPGADAIMQIARTPAELVQTGRTYFRLEMLSTVLLMFNTVYIAIERARGQTKRILAINMTSVLVKLALTAYFVFVAKAGIEMIAVATLISYIAISAFAVKNLIDRESAFGFSWKKAGLRKGVISPMLTLSLPVMLEKGSFSLGKVILNAMSAGYGALTVGALGVSNNISGQVTTLHSGFQDAGSAIISQNMGAGNVKRALDAFKVVLGINLIVGTVGYIVTMVYAKPIAWVFASSANGVDAGFWEMIQTLYIYNATGSCIPLAVNSAVMALLFGIGKTKYTLYMNLCRVFVFRVPVLWALQKFTGMGYAAVGVCMLVSNGMAMVMSSVVAVFVIRRICRENSIRFLS